MNGIIPSSGGQQTAVWTKIQAPDTVFMLRIRLPKLQLTRTKSPELHNFIATGGGQQAAVGAEHDTASFIQVSADCRRHLSGAPIPNTNFAIARTGGNKSRIRIGVESHTERVAHVSGKRNELMRIHVPQTDVVV